MTIYLGRNRPVNGTTEGSGSLFQWDIMLKYIAECFRVNHHCVGYDNISHYQYTNYNKNEWNDMFNSFFNFDNINKLNEPYKEIYFLSIDEDFVDFVNKYRNSKELYLVYVQDEYSIQKFCMVNNKIFDTQNKINALKSLNFNGEKYFDDNINIAMHLRSINPEDVDFNAAREYYEENAISDKYKNIFKFIFKNFKDKKINFHIYSQGNLERFLDFTAYENDLLKIYIHLNENPISDLYHMANADVLFMANSSFSYLAALMNPNLIIIRDSYWQFIPPNSIIVDRNYKKLLHTQGD